MSEALGVAITGHTLGSDAVLRLAREADALGYGLLLVDGDASLLPRRPESPIHDSTSLLAAVLAATERICAGSMRLPGYWNPVLLARSLATLQTLSSGRVVALLAAGHGRHEARLGLPELSAGQRLDLLDETLDVLRPLLAGREVRYYGERVYVDNVSITAPTKPPPLVVAAAQPRALRIAQKHGNVIDVNVPPLPERLEPVRESLMRELPLWMWVFARPGASADDAGRAWRKHAPWFRDVPEADAARAVLHGEPERCRDDLARMRETLGLDLPILDLAGLAEDAASAALRALAPAKHSPIL